MVPASFTRNSIASWGFQTVPAFRRFAKFDQPRHTQQRIGVALKAAGVPRQIDEQPVQNLLCINARCPIVKVGLADLREMSALFFRMTAFSTVRNRFRLSS
jgi:hypothetical protein